jgi:hypothetical protein
MGALHVNRVGAYTTKDAQRVRRIVWHAALPAVAKAPNALPVSQVSMFSVAFARPVRLIVTPAPLTPFALLVPRGIA